ncbi:MAG: hypothetical protein AAFP86_07490 [Planctomycetota bacterium]
MSRSNDPSSAPVVIALVAIASVVLFIALTDTPEERGPAQPAESPAAADGPDPFADVELELPRAGRSFPSAPEGVADHPDNLRARELARRGIALVESAFEARDAGDEELFLERATAGRDKLFEAKSMTSEWLLDLQERFPYDPQVRKIERQRTSWDRALKRVRHLR